jgi:hypothetical protein
MLQFSQNCIIPYFRSVSSLITHNLRLPIKLSPLHSKMPQVELSLNIKDLVGVLIWSGRRFLEPGTEGKGII